MARGSGEIHFDCEFLRGVAARTNLDTLALSIRVVLDDLGLLK